MDTLKCGNNSEREHSKRIQRDGTLSLDEAVVIARTEEATKRQLQNIKAQPSIHTMSRGRPHETRKP